MLSDECCANLPSSQKILQHWLEAHTPSSSPSLPPSPSLHPSSPSSPLDSSFLSSFPFPPSFSPPRQQPTVLSIHSLLDVGADINTTNADGHNLLHLAVLEQGLGCSRLETVQDLIGQGVGVNSCDNKGDSPLTLVRGLLDLNQFRLATDLASLLVKAGADVNHANLEGRTLLACSLAHLDNSFQLTTLLINAGARILPTPGQIRAHLPLNTFLRAVLFQHCDTEQSLLNCDKTLCDNPSASEYSLNKTYISHDMSTKGYGKVLCLLATSLSADPARMKQAVEAGLVAEARFPNSALPRLVESLRKSFAAYWTQPSSLSTLCLHRIRKSLAVAGGGGVLAGVDRLQLPARVKSYLKLEQMPKMLTEEKTDEPERTDLPPRQFWSQSTNIISKSGPLQQPPSQPRLSNVPTIKPVLRNSESHDNIVPQPSNQQRCLRTSLKMRVTEVVSTKPCEVEAITTSICLNNAIFKLL